MLCNVILKASLEMVSWGTPAACRTTSCGLTLHLSMVLQAAASMWPSCAWFMAVVLALAVCCGATNVNKRPLKAEAVQTSTLFPTIPRDVPHIAAPLLAINFTSDGNARLRGTAELLGESFLAASGPVDPDR